MYATTYYKEHGIVPDGIQLPVHVDTFEIHKMLHFKQINEVIGVPMTILRDLNPQYTHDIIPGNEGTFILRIPYTYANAFLDSEDSLYVYQAEDLFNTVNINKIKQNSPYGEGNRIIYRVKNGDYLGRIARRYHVSVSQIKKWNHLRSNNLKIGQKLVIYRKGAPSYSSSASSSSISRTVSTESDQTDASYSSYTMYTVKNGDTLYSIAKKFTGISANNIMEYNKIGSDIHPGMKIKIPR
jgi:membrane-bound lytic murein transglycosylase D